jgi:VIT1/CCC1 family predicted Fe2+/Mn2+ transporter
MTAETVQLPEALQALIDSRLDTIDRMLLGRHPRPDRLAIVREVEAQIFELLSERETRDLDRDDVLAVLARLDPPEAYLPDDADEEPASPRRATPSLPTPTSRRKDPRIAAASGIIGIATLLFVLLSPLLYLAAAAFNSEALALMFLFAALGLMFVGAVMAVVLATVGRLRGAWAVTGLVTGILSLLFASGAGLFLLLELLS